MRKFSENLKRLRIEKGLTLQELSEELGISIATLSRWENGINDIGSDNIIVLSNYFGISADELIGLS